MIENTILNSFSGKNALVTGGTGLIGRQVVELLCDAGANVTVVSLDKIVVDSRAKYIRADLTEFSVCKDLMRGMDDVFHLAGIKGSAKVSTSFVASHFVPTLMFNTNVLEAARINNAQRIVYTSSIGAYENAEVFVEGETGEWQGPPMDYAGWAKRMAELQIKAYNIQYGLENFAIVRPSNVYGPGDNFDPENAMVVGSLISRIDAGEDPLVVWGDGSAIRDLVYSRDVAEGILQAAYYGTKGRYVNLGCGEGYSIRELVETLQRVVDFNFEFDSSKPSGYPRRVMDINLAKDLIKYRPSTSLEDGLRQTYEWFIEHKQEYKDRHNYFEGLTA